MMSIAELCRNALSGGVTGSDTDEAVSQSRISSLSSSTLTGSDDSGIRGEDKEVAQWIGGGDDGIFGIGNAFCRASSANGRP
jgi:hypothetical protein